MIANHEEIETKALFPLCLDGRGARGESVLAALFGLAALLLAPQAALADNECAPVGTDPSANGGTADSYTCDENSYPSVTYDADGDLTIDVIGGGASRVDITDGDSGTDGFSLTATGGDSITFSNDLEIQDNNSDVVLDVLTDTGAINLLDLNEIDPGFSATHAIRAISTSGDITINDAGGNFSVVRGGANTGIEAVTGGDIVLGIGRDIQADQYGIRADTSGGAGTMLLDISGGNTTSISGGEAAIYATSGSGLMTININSDVNLGSGGAGDALIRTEAGGDAAINFLGSGSLEAPANGYVADMDAATATTTTLNIERVLAPGINVSGGVSANFGIAQEVVLRGAGAGEYVINIDNSAGGALVGGADFSGNTGGVTVNNGLDASTPTTTGWVFAQDAVTFGSGDDTVNNFALIMPNSGGDMTPYQAPGFGLSVTRVLREATMDFGDGQDVLNNSGTMVFGDAWFSFSTIGSSPVGIGSPRPYPFYLFVASDTTIQGLEEFNNDGLIVLGSWIAKNGHNDWDNFYPFDETGEQRCREALVGNGLPNPPVDGFPCSATILTDTDRLPNDVLALPNTTFTGGDDSRILMDVVFGLGKPQADCDAARTGERDYFRLPGGDCVDLRGGTTAGTTQLIVRDAVPLQQAAYNPEGIVLVDVGGGSSSEEHFVLSPLSDGYTTTAGGRGVLDKGLFAYPLIYDAANQQHKLLGIPGNRGLQMPLMGQEVQAGARQSTAAVHDRLASLRGSDPAKGGFWGDVTYDAVERDVSQKVSASGQQFTFGNDFDQDITTLTLGADSRLGDSAWRLGGSLGYVRSRSVFEETMSRIDFDGASLGVYGGYRAGALRVDASLLYGFLQVDYDDPVFNQDLNVAEIVQGEAPGKGSQDTEATSLEARVDAGWRIGLSEGLYVEPLAGLSWVRADIDDLDIPSLDPAQPGNTVVFDASTSFRGGLGARLGLDTMMSGVNVQYNLTARVWNEFDGESEATIESGEGDAQDANVDNEFDGTFSEISAGIDLSSPDSGLSGYLRANSMFGDDYDSTGGELGLRYRW